MSAEIKTQRLILRPWKQSDLEQFAQMNADPRVMEFFSSVRTWEESATEYDSHREYLDEHGWGLWAVSLIGGDDFIGMIGIKNIGFTAHFTPAVEIGWRLLHKHWGMGYATEGARASLEYGFRILELPEIVAITAVHNIRSRGVMEKLGMHCNPADDFDHPMVPEGNKVKRNVLYRLRKDEWKGI